MSEDEDSLWVRHLATLKGKWVIVTFTDNKKGNYWLQDFDESSVLILAEGAFDATLTERSVISSVKLDTERARGVWQRRP